MNTFVKLHGLIIRISANFYSMSIDPHLPNFNSHSDNLGTETKPYSIPEPITPNFSKPLARRSRQLTDGVPAISPESSIDNSTFDVFMQGHGHHRNISRSTTSSVPSMIDPNKHVGTDCIVPAVPALPVVTTVFRPYIDSI
jgi:hypothetical protein